MSNCKKCKAKITNENHAFTYSDMNEKWEECVSCYLERVGLKGKVNLTNDKCGIPLYLLHHLSVLKESDDTCLT